MKRPLHYKTSRSPSSVRVLVVDPPDPQTLFFPFQRGNPVLRAPISAWNSSREVPLCCNKARLGAQSARGVGICSKPASSGCSEQAWTCGGVLSLFHRCAHCPLRLFSYGLSGVHLARLGGQLRHRMRRIARCVAFKNYSELAGNV